LFLSDGRIALDNNAVERAIRNAVERAIRPIALNRKKRAVRRSRRWCPELGRHRLADRKQQA